jgi:tetratricopeptide (TPR) repeat protein
MDESTRSQSVENIAEVFDSRQEKLEAEWRIDPTVLWVMRPFGDNALHLAKHHPEELSFSIGCGVLGQAELTIGSLAKGQSLTNQFLCNLRSAYEKNEENQEINRLLSAALVDQGDFYRARGKSGDAELALVQFEESLDIRKQLAEANPNSAQALRDLSVSLERMSDVIGQQEKENSSRDALALQIEALQISLTLHESNPSSLFLGKTAAITAIRAFQKAQTAGSTDVAGQCLSVCYSVLQTLKSNGCEFDQSMEQTYQQLHEVLSQQDKTESG